MFYEREPRLRVRHIVFGCFICGLMLFGLIGIYIGSGPIILGTELNTNGQVEYMCFGNDCEDLNQFRWSDK